MFYDYQQNNSGGSFTGPAINVIVEADSVDDANRRAEDLGLYWYGADHDGPDCPCCGDRWYQAYKEGEVVPSLYGKPVKDSTTKSDLYEWLGDGRPWIMIAYKDGTKEYIEK
jgi:hypothetical protein